MSTTVTQVISGIGIFEIREHDARLREVRMTNPNAPRLSGFSRFMILYRFLIHPATTIVRFPDLRLVPDQLESMNGKTITFMAEVNRVDRDGAHELMCDRLTVHVHD